MMGHRVLGDTLYYAGEFVAARTHIEQAIVLYDAEQHRSFAFLYGVDPLVGSRIWGANILWALGYLDQSMKLAEDAVAWAEQLSHPYSLAYALLHAAHI